MRSKQFVGIAGALAVAAWCASVAVAGADPAPEPAPGPAPGPAQVTFEGDGTYAVGADIVPGTYRSEGPIEGSACYWKRVRGEELVDNAMSKKVQIVKIEADDTSFKTSDCQTWHKIEDCLPGCAPPGTSPGDLLGQLGRIMLTNPGGPPPAGSR